MNALHIPSACPPRYHLWVLLRRLRVGILTTRSVRGIFSSRPMLVCNGKHDVGRVMYFFVSADSLWLRDLAHDPNVSLVYADFDHQQFLSVSGAGRVKHCLAAQQARWGSQAEREFPGGPGDPMVRLLEVDIASACFQNGPSRHDLTGDGFNVGPPVARKHQTGMSGGYRLGNRI